MWSTTQRAKVKELQDASLNSAAHEEQSNVHPITLCQKTILVPFLLERTYLCQSFFCNTLIEYISHRNPLSLHIRSTSSWPSHRRRH